MTRFVFSLSAIVAALLLPASAFALDPQVEAAKGNVEKAGDGQSRIRVDPAGTVLSAPLTSAASPSFAAFDARARAGDRLTVVFFGASLTWCANATDHNDFSYRARVAARLTEKYPQARFRFHDAAIGGTGSQLGVFRLDRASDHTLRIVPVFDPDKEQELRFESLCVAGGDARVISAGPR
jgi:hypothetical protein